MKAIEKENIFEKIVAYLFGELEAEEENQFDNYLNTDEETASLVDDVIDYCQKNNIKDRASLEAKLKKDTAFATEGIDQIIKNTKPDLISGSNKKRYIWGFLFLLIALRVGLYFYASSNNIEQDSIDNDSIENAPPQETEINNISPPPIDEEGEIELPLESIDESVQEGKNQSGPIAENLSKEDREKIVLADALLKPQYQLTYEKGPISENSQIREDYGNGKYDLVIKSIDSLLNNQTPSETASSDLFFVKGLSLLYKDKYTDAIKSFQSEINLTKENYNQEARWFMALTYIKNQQFAQAKLVLREISENPNRHYNKTKATNLLKELEN